MIRILTQETLPDLARGILFHKTLLAPVRVQSWDGYATTENEWTRMVYPDPLFGVLVRWRHGTAINGLTYSAGDRVAEYTEEHNYTCHTEVQFMLAGGGALGWTDSEVRNWIYHRLSTEHYYKIGQSDLFSTGAVVGRLSALRNTPAGVAGDRLKTGVIRNSIVGAADSLWRDLGKNGGGD